MLYEIPPAELPALLPCILALSAHHNRVSLHHKGSYPTNPPEKTMERFAHALGDGSSKIAVVRVDDTQVCATQVVGFCKIDLTPPVGKLDWLVVLEEFRGRGYGTALMDWAMAAFREAGIAQVELKVVAGNDAAVRLYEKYGFQLNAYILRRTEKL